MKSALMMIALAAAWAAAGEDQDRPNVLLLLADDMPMGIRADKK